MFRYNLTQADVDDIKARTAREYGRRYGFPYGAQTDTIPDFLSEVVDAVFTADEPATVAIEPTTVAVVAAEPAPLFSSAPPAAV